MGDFFNITMRFNITEMIKQWKRNKNKQTYLQARAKLLESYGDTSELTVEEVAGFEKAKKALYAIYFEGKQ